MVVQAEEGTVMAPGTAGEEEVVVVVEVVEGVEGAEQGQVAASPQGLHLERGGPAVDWGISPSMPASVQFDRRAGSLELVLEGAEVEEGAEMPLHWCVEQVGVLGEEE